MAKIIPIKIATSVGVGIADEALEYVDGRQGYTKSFMNSTDIVRTAEFVAGVGGTIMSKKANQLLVLEPLMYSSTPLFIKSLARGLKTYIFPKAKRLASKSGFKIIERGQVPDTDTRTSASRTRYV